MNYGPGPGVDALQFDEATGAGFFGELPWEDFIHPEALCSYLDLPLYINSGVDDPWNNQPGNIFYNIPMWKEVDTDPELSYANGWLKYIVDGKICFMPKLPFLCAMKWSEFYNRGCVFGIDDFQPTQLDNTLILSQTKWPISTLVEQGAFIGINGTDYNIRFPNGVNPGEFGPLPYGTYRSGYSGTWNNTAKTGIYQKDSEWGRIMPRIFSWGVADWATYDQYDLGARWDGDTQLPGGGVYHLPTYSKTVAMELRPLVDDTQDLPVLLSSGYIEGIWPIASSYNADGSGYFCWRPVLQIAVVKRKFWTGFKGTEEYEIEEAPQ